MQKLKNHYFHFTAMFTAIYVPIFSQSSQLPYIAPHISHIELSDAEECSKAGLYHQAIPTYQQLLQQLSCYQENHDTALAHDYLKYILGYLYLATNAPEKATKILSSPSFSLQYPEYTPLLLNTLYLQAIAHKQLHEYSSAILSLQNYHLISSHHPHPLQHQANLLMALSYFKCAQFMQAAGILIEFIQNTKDLSNEKHLQAYAKCMLAQIALIYQHPQYAIELLQSISPEDTHYLHITHSQLHTLANHILQHPHTPPPVFHDIDPFSAQIDPIEILYAQALLAKKQFFTTGNSQFLEQAKNGFSTIISLQDPLYTPLLSDTLLQMASIHYIQKNYPQSIAIYSQFLETYPQHPLIDHAFFWIIQNMEKQHLPTHQIQEKKREFIQKFPQSTYTPEIAFTQFSYQEYLSGNKEIKKNLQAITKLYPTSPFASEAYYLLGLDYKKNRKTEKGQWITKKHLLKSIDAFYKGEEILKKHTQAKSLPQERLSYYETLLHQITLERAFTHLQIAHESTGTKKQIYLEYAEEIFEQLSHSLHNKTEKTVSQYTMIEEVDYHLAHLYLQKEKSEKASILFDQIIQTHKDTSPSYFFVQSLIEKASILLQKKETEQALSCLALAEQTIVQQPISEQTIELWILTSQCQKQMHQYEAALKSLSKAINDPLISPLRIEAMYLRAEIYIQQQRFELAKKQFEAIISKGGKLGEAAKQQIEQLPILALQNNSQQEE